MSHPESVFWLLLSSLSFQFQEIDEDVFNVLPRIRLTEQIKYLSFAYPLQVERVQRWIGDAPLPNLEHLSLNNVTGPLFAAVMAHPQWSIHLSVEWSDVLGSFECLPHTISPIKSLSMSGGKWEDVDACEALMAWSGFSNLERLTIFLGALEQQALVHALHCAHMPQLQWLEIQSYITRTDALDYIPLVSLPNFPSLAGAMVVNIPIQPCWVDDLLTGSPSLTRLVTYQVEMTDQILASICQKGLCLRDISLAHSHVTATGIEYLTQSSIFEQLESFQANSDAISIFDIHELHNFKHKRSLSPGEWFGELRSLIHRTSPSSLWETLTEFLLPSMYQDDVVANYLPYIEQQLNYTGARQRQMPERWLPFVAFEPTPVLFSLINSIVAKGGPRLQHVLENTELKHIKRLTIEGGVSADRVELLLASNLMEQLDALTLHYCHAGKHILPALLDAAPPQLRELTYIHRDCKQGIHQHFVQHPFFSQLTAYTFNIAAFNTVDFLRAGQAHALEHLDGANEQGISWDALSAEHVPNLRALHMRQGSRNVPTSCVFDHLNDVTINTRLDPASLDALKSWSMPLRRLSLQTSDMEDDVLAGIIQTWPSLETLAVELTSAPWKEMQPISSALTVIDVKTEDALDEVLNYLARCSWSSRSIALSVTFSEWGTFTSWVPLIRTALFKKLRVLHLEVGSFDHPALERWREEGSGHPIVDRALRRL